MPRTCDVLVVGLGAIGSATLCHLARQGVRAVGLDQFSPPHELGSSHGQTRIIREAYFEHPLYVPLVRRALELWRELEETSGEKLYLRTGGLMIGPPEGILVSGSLASAREHHLPHEILTRQEIQRRFPALNPEEDMIGLLEPRAGILFPERCVASHLAAAQKHGAIVQLNEKVTRWQTTGRTVLITTPAGSYEARKVVFCSGAWLPRLVPELHARLKVERQVLHWFAPLRNQANFSAANCPVHLWEYQPGRMFYGFPDLGQGVKTAIHHQGSEADPDHLDRVVSPDDESRMRALVSRFLPDADGPLRSAMVCMYTNTRDEHFVLGPHRSYPGVILGSACSGHGFKFSSVIGEVLADLALDRAAQFDLSLFCVDRVLQ